MILFSLWSFIIIISFIGYGTLLDKLFISSKICQTGIWLRSGLGLAFMTILGGILNLLRIITPATLISILIIGCVYYIIYLCKNRKELWILNAGKLKYLKRPLYLLPTLVVMIFLAMKYIASIYSINFNWHDDFNGYIVFPIKMLQTGYLGDDPFSYTRLLSLSGMSFLNTLVLAVGNFQNLKLMDSGIGYILVSGLIINFKRFYKISYLWLLFIIMLFLIVVPSPRNVSSMLTGTVLFITLFQLMIFIEKNNYTFRYGTAIIIGLVLAGFASLKSSHIVPSTLICIIIFLIIIFCKSEKNVKQVAILSTIPLITFILVFPWMLSNLSSNGTMLFPILGKGYHASNYGLWDNSYQIFSIRGLINWLPSVILYTAILVITILFIIILLSNIKSPISFKFLWFPCILYLVLISTIMIIIVLTGGIGWTRYSWPYALSVFIFFLVSVLSTRSMIISYYKLIPQIVIIVGFICLLVVKKDIWMESLNGTVSSINSFKNKSNVEVFDSGIYYGKIDQLEKNRYVKMQNSVPENETILTRLNYPFLLDFNRNQIYVADFPGGSSIPDGMPLFKGSIKLVNYFINNGIRYIAYSYKSEANYKYDDLKRRLNNRNFIANEAKLAFEFQRNLSELGLQYKRIYDDGGMFVIDLKQPI